MRFAVALILSWSLYLFNDIVSTSLDLTVYNSGNTASTAGPLYLCCNSLMSKRWSLMIHIKDYKKLPIASEI